MGISSSTESNSRYDLISLKNLNLDEMKKETNLEERSEKERAAILAMHDACLEVWWDGLHVLFPATKGELSTDQPKEEGGTEMDEDNQVFERFSDFMKEGGCKEPFTALVDCSLKTGSIAKCAEHLPVLKSCMDARIGYYEPILALAKATENKAIDFCKAELAASQKGGGD